MYTTTIIALGILVLVLFIINFKTTNKIILSLWLLICCTFSWVEFSSMNYFDPQMEAWKFSPQHIIEFRFLLMEIEDFLFAPICGVLFFYFYKWIDRGINYQSSELCKLITLCINIFICFFFICWGGYFGKYQAWRMILGIACIIYTWESFDVRQFFVVMAGIFIIAGLWDIWANSLSTPQQWYYRDIVSLKYSKVYADFPCWWFKIGKGWFPLSIFPYYYISGGTFTYGIISALFKFRKRISNETKNK